MSAELISVIEKIVQKAIEKLKLPVLGVGTIEQNGDVFIDANVEPYPSQAFDIPDSLKDRKVPIELDILSGTATCSCGEHSGTVNLAGSKIVGTLSIKTGLKEGDRILFISQVGGQEFAVVGRSSNGDLTRG